MRGLETRRLGDGQAAADRGAGHRAERQSLVRGTAHGHLAVLQHEVGGVRLEQVASDPQHLLPHLERRRAGRVAREDADPAGEGADALRDEGAVAGDDRDALERHAEWA